MGKKHGRAKGRGRGRARSRRAENAEGRERRRAGRGGGGRFGVRGRAAVDLKTRRRSRRRRHEVVTTTGVTDDRERHDSPRRPGPTHASSPPRAQPCSPRDGHPLARSRTAACLLFFPPSAFRVLSSDRSPRSSASFSRREGREDSHGATMITCTKLPLRPKTRPQAAHNRSLLPSHCCYNCPSIFKDISSLPENVSVRSIVHAPKGC